MKFSILLPTRDRLELLKLAIESIRRQDYSDWEIVVSDNASGADIAGYVASLNDTRIRCHQTRELIPVTDNWNAALDRATGDYFIMLGDDDVLAPESLTEARRLIDAWNGPNAIYAQAHQYAYPEVIPDHPEPFIQTGYNAFLEGVHEPFLLPRETALKMVKAAMSFYILYGYNMQHFVVSRRLVEKLAAKGPFFQSPYPDYYAANAVLLAADPLVVTPRPLAMIGISPKSFGFHYFNNREQDGVKFLQNLANKEILEKLRGQFVPGSNMNDSWLCAMETLLQNFPEVTGLRVRYHRYRGLQYRALLAKDGIGDALRHMKPWEIPLYGVAALIFAALRIFPLRLRRRVRRMIFDPMFSRSPSFDLQRVTVSYRNILDAAWSHGV